MKLWHRRWHRAVWAAGLLVLSLSLVSSANPVPPAPAGFVVAGGGGRGYGGPWRVEGGIGQSAAGRLQDGVWTLESGFWVETDPVRAAAQPVWQAYR